MPTIKRRKIFMPTNDETDAIISDKQQAREKFEQERFSRRAALRKLGITSGMALFSLFAVDDLARIAIKKLEEHKQTHEIGETVAQEFKNTGVVFAATPGHTSACVNCVDAKTGCLGDSTAGRTGCLAGAKGDQSKRDACISFYAGEDTGCQDAYIRCCSTNLCNC